MRGLDEQNVTFVPPDSHSNNILSDEVEGSTTITDTGPGRGKPNLIASLHAIAPSPVSRPDIIQRLVEVTHTIKWSRFPPRLVSLSTPWRRGPPCTWREDVQRVSSTRTESRRHIRILSCGSNDAASRESSGSMLGTTYPHAWSQHRFSLRSS